MFCKSTIDDIDILYYFIYGTNAAVIIIEKNESYLSLSIIGVDIKNKIIKLNSFGTHYNMSWDTIIKNYTIEVWEFKPR